MGDDAKLSEEEFRRKLYKWLEDQGLLSELRSHLRQQMIAALRGTSLGAHTANNSQAASPKIQALNLLVAEFLLSHEFHYTLSVFTSEVPLLRNLPQFSKVFKSINRGEVPPIEEGKRNGSYPRLQEREVWDILETLRLPPDCNAGSYVFRRYQQKLNEPLLTSIVCSVPKVIQKWGITELLNNKPPPGDSSTRDDLEASGDRSVAEKQLKNCASENFSDELHKTLQKLHLKPKNYKRIEDDLKSMLQCELERLQKEERDRFQRELTEREERIQKALAEREEEFHQSLIRAEQQLEEQRQTLMMKFQEREAQIIDLAKNMESKCKGQASEEKCSESNTERVKESVNCDNQSDSSGANNNKVEDKNAKARQGTEEKEFKKIHKAASAQWKLSSCSSRDFAVAKKESQTAQFDFSEYQALLEESFAKQETLTKQLEVYQAQQMLMQDMLHRLQQENCNLRQEIFQQRSEINDLNSRANELTAELQTARPSVSSAAPPPPPPLPPRTAPAPRELASGEEVRYHTSPVATQTLPKNGGSSSRDWRRRHHRRITLGSSSEETSPTEEILRDARLRLRQLEEESEAVDRSYRDFRMRQSVNPVLFQAHRPFLNHAVYDFASCNLQASRNGQGPVYDSYKNAGFSFSPPFGGNHHFHTFLHTTDVNSVREEANDLPEPEPPEALPVASVRNEPSATSGGQETRVHSSQASGSVARTTDVRNFPLVANLSRAPGEVAEVTKPAVAGDPAEVAPSRKNGQSKDEKVRNPKEITATQGNVQSKDQKVINRPSVPPVASSDPKELAATRGNVQSKDEVINRPSAPPVAPSCPKELTTTQGNVQSNDDKVRNRPSAPPVASSGPKELTTTQGNVQREDERVIHPTELTAAQGNVQTEDARRKEKEAGDPNRPVAANHGEDVVDAEEVGARLEEKLSRLLLLDAGAKLRGNASSVYLSDVILDGEITSETKLGEGKGKKSCPPSPARNGTPKERRPSQDRHQPGATSGAGNLGSSTEPSPTSTTSTSVEPPSVGGESREVNGDSDIW